MYALLPILAVGLCFLCSFLLVLAAVSFWLRVILKITGHSSPTPKQFRKELALALICGAFLLLWVGMFYWSAGN
jgi:hypothetical protein